MSWAMRGLTGSIGIWTTEKPKPSLSLRTSCQLHNHSPFGFSHRLNRQPRSFPQQHHTLQFGFFPEPIERYTGFERLTVLDVDHIPAGSSNGAGRIIVVTALIKLRLVGVCRFDHLGNSNDRWRIRIAMVKQHVITDGHLSHEISGLVIPNSIPTGGLLGCAD